VTAHVRGLLRPYEGVSPSLGDDAFVADSAVVVGDVVVGPGSSIWYGAVLRGDVMPIRVGARSNIQDLTMVHGTTGLAASSIGDEVTVGHRVILHGCTIHDRVLVGMGAIVLDLAVIESDVVVGAGSLVTPRSRLESGWLYLGSPAKKVRRLTEADRGMIEEGWRAYAHLAVRHR
jgi:carbonic anhydrase/acetyltransferase-like protein (isoleucine patch superfamily)